MVVILIVEKTGNLKETNVKSSSEFYKKAGYKNEEGFRFIHKWNIPLQTKTYNISLFGKTTGKANTENKYDFPPPVDTELFFGNCILVNQDEGNDYKDLKLSEWETIYEYLFGGFEDLNDEDSLDEDIENDDDIGDVPLTKVGKYLKDGFVVDDDINDEEGGEEEEEQDDEDEEEQPDIIIKSKKNKKKTVKSVAVTANKINESMMLFECKSELSEESYIE